MFTTKHSAFVLWCVPLQPPDICLLVIVLWKGLRQALFNSLCLPTLKDCTCIQLNALNFLTLFLAGIIINLFWAEKHWRQQDATVLKTAPSSLLLTFAMAKTNQEIQSTCKETVRTQSQHFFIQIYIRSPKQFLFPSRRPAQCEHHFWLCNPALPSAPPAQTGFS